VTDVTLRGCGRSADSYTSKWN